MHKYLQANIHDSKGKGYDYHKGRKYLVPVIDSFQVVNKEVYTVLVTDLLIPFLTLSTKQVFQLDMKPLLLQFVQGISFLHSKGITHGGK
jgi:hypothetical protein